MSDVLDLDALVPPQVTIKFGGEEIQVNPPSTIDLLRLGHLGQKLQDAEKLNEEELASAVEGLVKQVQKCIPQLQDKSLNTIQLLKLVEILSAMAVPADAVELQKRGITTDSPKA